MSKFKFKFKDDIEYILNQCSIPVKKWDTIIANVFSKYSDTGIILHPNNKPSSIKNGIKHNPSINILNIKCSLYVNVLKIIYEYIKIDFNPNTLNVFDSITAIYKLSKTKTNIKLSKYKRNNNNNISGADDAFYLNPVCCYKSKYIYSDIVTEIHSKKAPFFNTQNVMLLHEYKAINIYCHYYISEMNRMNQYTMMIYNKLNSDNGNVLWNYCNDIYKENTSFNNINNDISNTSSNNININQNISSNNDIKNISSTNDNNNYTDLEYKYIAIMYESGDIIKFGTSTDDMRIKFNHDVDMIEDID